jgi:hypothetical protein
MGIINIIKDPRFLTGVVVGAVVVPWGLKRFAPGVKVPGVS